MRAGQWIGCAGLLALLGSTGVGAGQTPPQARLVAQLGHAYEVTSVAFSPDGREVLTGSKDMTARLWETASGNEIRRFEGHTDHVTSVAFSPDGREVLTGSRDKSARLWDAATGQELRRFEGHTDHVTSVAFSPDGSEVLTGSGDKTARLWDAASGKELRQLAGHTDAIRSVAFSADGRSVLTGSADTTARLWDAATGQELRRYAGHTKGVNGVAFSPDGKRVLTGSDDHTAILWDAADGRKLRRLAGHDDAVLAVAFSRDGRRVATGGLDFYTVLWDAASGRKLLRLMDDYVLDEVLSVAFSADGRELLTGASKTAQMWDIASAKVVRRFEGHAFWVTAVSFSPDGRYLLSGSASIAAQEHLWDSNTGKQERHFGESNAWVMSAAFSPDGREVLTGSPDHTAHLWDPASGEELKRFKGHTNVVTSVAFSPDGREVLTGSMDQTVRLWDIASGQELRRFDGHTYWVTAVAYSPDGRTVLSGAADKTVRLWDASSGKELLHYMDATDALDVVTSVSFSPDGRYVLAGSKDKTARLWDAVSGKLLRRFEGHSGSVLCVAFSADGRYVLTGSADGTVRLWDTAGGQELQRFEGHTNAFTSVKFSPDGRYVLTGNYDGTTRLWDVKTGQWLVSLISFDNGGWAVVDPDGRFDTSDLDGGAALHWVVDDDPMRALPLEIFMRDYYTPGLLARVMKGEKLPQVRSIMEIQNRIQPEVRVASVKPSQKTAGRVDVMVHAASVTDEKGKKSGLQDLRLFRDGQMVADGYRVGALADGNFVFRDVMLKNDAKKVTFTAYAFNKERIKSATASLDYEVKTPVSAAVKRRAFLLQVGVNHTAASGCDLSYSVNDAEKMSAVLRERLEKQGFALVAVKLESDAGSDASGAAKELIRGELKRIAAKATPDDAFFMSFSGHGYAAADGEFYILPSSLEGSCSHVDKKLLASAISADELSDWLRPIDAGEMTLILDACHSAESVEAGNFKPGPMGSRGLGQVAYDKRMRVLAASQSAAVAYEFDYLHQGLLSYVLVQDGLGEGKADWKPKDGKITLGEWLSYAAAAVPEFKPPPTSDNKGTSVEMTGAGAKAVGQVPALFDFSRGDALVLAK